MPTIAIASGKGGTGKTTVATALALALARRGTGVTYADCDVEEPNGHVFLHPAIERTCTVSVLRPVVTAERCSGCGACARLCRFSAILCLGEKALTFGQLCHGCGGCAAVCPEEAIVEEPFEIGVVERGRAGPMAFAQGCLRVGQAMATPVIRALKRDLPRDGIVILDAPPGSACPVIETLRGADYVLLVAEPTPFGLHDLNLSVDVLHAMALPFGVVLNRSDGGDERVSDYCAARGIALHLRIPFDRAVAEAYSRGEDLLAVRPDLTPCLLNLIRAAEGGGRACAK